MVHDEIAWVAGLDGCKGGWIAVLHPVAERAMAKIGVFKSFSEACVHLPRQALIGVDMPIGLPDRVEAGGRAPDRAARLVVGQRRHSVFPVPSRAAVYAFAQGYPASLFDCAGDLFAALGAVETGVLDLSPRIQEVDLALQADWGLAGRVFEIHPEVSFRMMHGAPLGEPKKKGGRCHADGMKLRKDLLRAQGFTSELVDQTPPRGVGLDDLLDACAVVWSAARVLTREALVLPDPPGVDDMGLRVAIWA